ncbi:hypothetical protein [Catellatospora paridis]|uniref:hypothetical protein n=1 Tax=Catellatospora paridis TaxID=1617086 RepID=UPI0012D37EE2|nr:hypothetical protein [Catellatospora paridis]
MPIRIRIRPDAQYLMLLGLVCVPVVLGVIVGGGTGTAVAVAGAAFLVLAAFPVVVSTLLRVPVLVITDEGLRMPLMGPALGWDEIADVRDDLKVTGSRLVPVLLIVPTEPQDAVWRLRPWLRGEGRANLARFGTPLVIQGGSLSWSLADIRTAIRDRIDQS